MANLVVLVACLLLASNIQVVFFLLSVSQLTDGLIAVCYLKREPPRWRWGDK
jgi:hypothetical protein